MSHCLIEQNVGGSRVERDYSQLRPTPIQRGDIADASQVVNTHMLGTSAKDQAMKNSGERCAFPTGGHIAGAEVIHYRNAQRLREVSRFPGLERRGHLWAGPMKNSLAMQSHQL